MLSMKIVKMMKKVLPPGASDEKRGCSGVSYLNLLSVKVAGKLLELNSTFQCRKYLEHCKISAIPLTSICVHFVVHSSDHKS